MSAIWTDPDGVVTAVSGLKLRKQEAPARYSIGAIPMDFKISLVVGTGIG
jgi:hypothetical protein